MEQYRSSIQATRMHSKRLGPLDPQHGVHVDSSMELAYVPSIRCYSRSSRSLINLYLTLPLLIILVFIASPLMAHSGGDFNSLNTISRAAASRHVARQASSAAESLRNFQVTAPVYTPTHATCTQTLMVHSFGNSYGTPFVGAYNPPSCEFDHIVFNFTVTSRGRQFDRLGIMYLNDTEIFRTSTAEPTPNGIVWTYIKDMSSLLSLFQEPQKIIFDLPNIIDQTYTGYLNATLTATFFKQDSDAKAADVILPVSARQSAQNSPSVFQVPDVNASNQIMIPKNVRKAFFTIASCGQQTEEFWYTNVLNSTVATFPGGTLYGYSPWREVQLLIDGTLAGIAWPFPVIFTGGIVPGFWRPIAGIDAFDLKEDEIDITPWLPLLTDGKEHTFTIQVAGIGSDGSLSSVVGEYWLVTGKIFLWLDAPSSQTTGSMTVYSAPEPVLDLQSSTTKDTNGTNTTLSYSVLAKRNLEFTSSIRTSSGTHFVSWKQSVSYSNHGNIADGGYTQTTSQTTTGTDFSTQSYSRNYSYPIIVFNTFTDDTTSGGNLTIDGTFDRAKNVHASGRGAFFTPLDTLPPFGQFDATRRYPAYSLLNHQSGNATFTENASNNASSSTGRTEQQYVLRGVNRPSGYGSDGSSLLYERDVVAQDAAVVSDVVHGAIGGQSNGGTQGYGHRGEGFIVQAYPPTRDIARMLGREPPR